MIASKFWKFALSLALVLQTAWSTVIVASPFTGCTSSANASGILCPTSGDPNCTGTFQTWLTPTCSTGDGLGCQPIYVSWKLIELYASCTPTGNSWSQIAAVIRTSAPCDGVEGSTVYACWTPTAFGLSAGYYIIEADFFDGYNSIPNYFHRHRAYAYLNLLSQWSICTSDPPCCPPL